MLNSLTLKKASKNKDYTSTFNVSYSQFLKAKRNYSNTYRARVLNIQKKTKNTPIGQFSTNSAVLTSNLLDLHQDYQSNKLFVKPVLFALCALGITVSSLWLLNQSNNLTPEINTSPVMTEVNPFEDFEDYVQEINSEPVISVPVSSKPVVHESVKNTNKKRTVNKTVKINTSPNITNSSFSVADIAPEMSYQRDNSVFLFSPEIKHYTNKQILKYGIQKKISKSDNLYKLQPKQITKPTNIIQSTNKSYNDTDLSAIKLAGNNNIGFPVKDSNGNELFVKQNTVKFKNPLPEN